jgi:hypothetical protein
MISADSFGSILFGAKKKIQANHDSFFKGYVEFQTQDGNYVSPDLADLDILKYTIRITRDTVASTLSNSPLWWTPGSKNGGR